jgi:hypothetical protein
VIETNLLIIVDGVGGGYLISCVCARRGCRVSAVLFPTPLVCDAPHDISPPLENQLVHELEGRVEGAKFFKCHPAAPGRRGHGKLEVALLATTVALHGTT